MVTGFIQGRIRVESENFVKIQRLLFLVKESEEFLSSDEVKEFRDRMMETFNACMNLMNEQQKKLRKEFFDVSTELARLCRSV